ncbi:MAG: nitronate monooxygenase [Bacteroidetes bacterium HGW-Bacteroidetes-16]|nr:MAG: nitronate monooxygenase [Bacteroidetes bacterium HGW-Bacteroidetes-16]
MKRFPLFEALGAQYPILMAPMFLVTNTQMMVAALKSGITAAVPALNYRTDSALREAIGDIRRQTDKPFGVNLIVNKSNIKYKQQLKTCAELKVGFIITSLGNPKETIELCKPLGIKVFCDVVDLLYAKKVADLGADAVIAVSSLAGGHSGNLKPEELVPMLKKQLPIPVISAGGIATSASLEQALELGADGVSIGTAFIASIEAGVSEEYKQALVEYSAKDIILTKIISGTPLTVINTPYMQSLGTNPSLLNKLMYKNKFLKKYIKMLIAFRGMKTIEHAASKATYKTVWVAGPSIQDIHKIRPVSEIVASLTKSLIK